MMMALLEVHRAPLRIGQAAVVQHLQKHVEHVRVRLFDFVKQHHRIGLSAHGLGQLAALLVAHVSRRRSDQAGHGEFLHVLAHVDAYHGLLVVKQRLCQRLGQLGFAYAGRA